MACGSSAVEVTKSLGAFLCFVYSIYKWRKAGSNENNSTIKNVSSGIVEPGCSV